MKQANFVTQLISKGILVFACILVPQLVKAQTTPIFTASTSLTVCQNSTANAINSNLSIVDAGTGLTETWDILSGSLHGSLGGFPATATSTGGIVTPSGLSYTPTTGYSGLDSFIITVFNGTNSDTTKIIVSVTALPNAGTISGVTTFCQGRTNTLTASVTGGVWSSTNPAVASVNTTGVVAGLTSGSSTISYTVTNSCGTAAATRTQTVNPLPIVSAIGGTLTACAGFSSLLTDSTTGGTWSTSNASIASVSTSGLVSAISVGTATITYSVSNSCGATRVFASFNVTAGISAGTISGATSVCAGATASLSSTVSGGVWSSSDVTVASVDGPGNVTGVSPGSAAIIYTFTTSCGSVFSTYPMTVNPAPDPGVITGSGSPCPGTTITLSDAVTGGTWSSSDNTIATVDAAGVVTGVLGGTVTISYAVTNSCGTASATSTVVVNPSPDAGSISGVPVICVGSSTTLTDGVTGGTWSSSNTSIATISTTGVVTGTGTGTVTLSYTVTNSCGTAFATQSMTVNTTPSAGTITGATSVCAGSSTTLADAVSGGTWRSSNSTIATVSTGGVVRGVSAGTVTISYMVITSCGSATATTTFTVSGAPSAGTILGTPVACVGTTSTLASTVSGGTWSSSDASVASVDAATGDVTGVSTGTATISYSVAGTCGTGRSTVSFTVNTAATAGTVSGASTICTGSTTTFSSTVTGGGWNSSDVSVATVDGFTGNVTGVGAGTATITYTVSSSCGVAIATSGITVTAGSTAGTISGATSVCTGSTTTLTSTTTGGSWSTTDASIASVDAATGDVTGIADGTVTISYTETSSCGTTAATASMTVISAPSAGAISGVSSLCTGGSATLTGAVSGGSWSTSDASVVSVDASGNITGNTAGTATISYTVSNSCGSATSTLSVSVGATAAAGTISGPSSVCTGSSVTLTDGVSGGTWSTSDASVASVGAATGVVYGIATGTATITYTVTTTCGTANTTATITVGAGATVAAISGTTTLCAGATTTLTDATAGGAWSSSNTSVATISSTGTVTAVAAGTSTISYTVTSSCGAVSATATFTVNPLPAAGTISGSSSLCAGAGTTLSSSVSGGTWSSSNTSVAAVSSAGVVTGVAAGTATISYSVSGSCGTGVATAAITVNAIPSAGAITGAGSVCTGASAALSASVTGGTWSSSNTSVITVSSTGVVTGVGTGTATISYTVTNTSGCSATATYIVGSGTGAPSGTITPAGAASLCAGSPVHLSISSSAAGLSVQWYRSGSLIAGATATTYTATTAGFYAAIISNGCGADTLTGVTVLAAPNPVISLAGTNILSTGSFASYQWFRNGVAISGANSSTYNYTTAGSYTVRVTNGAGCTVMSAAYTVSGGGGTNGLTDVNAVASVNVYPNPATSIVHIDADVNVNVIVLTAVGRTILDTKNAKEIDLSSFADGMYMVMVYDENNTLLKAVKLVKAQ